MEHAVQSSDEAVVGLRLLGVRLDADKAGSWQEEG